jgi:hypothetical protein
MFFYVARANWLKGRVPLRRIDPGYELGSTGIELSPVFEIASCRIMARKEVDCEKKTSCAI